MSTRSVEIKPLQVWLRRGLAFVTGLYAALLVFATHYPKPEELVGGPLPSDKLMHFVAYGVLGLLAAAVCAAYGRRSRGMYASLLGALAVAAVLDEATQPLFRRAADPADWVFDCIGLSAGVAVVFVADRASRMSQGVRPLPHHE